MTIFSFQNKFESHRVARRLSQQFCWYCVAMVIAMIGSNVHADLVWLKGKSEPVCGRVASSPDNAGQSTIEFRSFDEGRFGKKQTFEMDEIELLVKNIDINRLESLHPDQPNFYRQYAEELSAQKNDLAARDLARRLYLIAAINSGDALQRSSLLGLLSLADSPEEYKRVKMLCVLSAPALVDSGGWSLNQYSIDSQPSGNQSDIGPTDQKLMLQLIQTIRRENSELSLRLLKESGNRKIFKKWNEVCNLAELERIANSKRPDTVQLAKLLSIELKILHPNSAGLGQKRKAQGWGDFAAKPSATLGVLPTFENVTRFDPNRSVFRNGYWVLP